MKLERTKRISPPEERIGLRRWSMFGVLAMLLGLASAQAAAPAATTTARPNIVLILSDDMGWSDIGCFGGEISTPNLDKLAANGVRFSQFYNTGRCCPTRASLLTGLYAHQASVGHMMEDRGHEAYRGDLNLRTRTIAETLKPSGYSCYAVGKWHVTRHLLPDAPKHNWPLQRGFDRFYGTITGGGDYFDPATLTRDNAPISPFADPEYKPAQYYYTDAISDQAARFIREHSRGSSNQPFFLYAAYTAAHWPMHAKEQDIAKYKGKYDGGYEPVRRARLEKLQKLGLIRPDWPPAPTQGRWETVEDKAWEARGMEVYAAMVDCLDQGIGRIVDTLEKSGQLDNTLLFFLQDNGGCAEGIGRGEKMERSIEPIYPRIPAEALRHEVRPKQNRAGFPMRQGRPHLPGPGDTFMAYGEAWANISNTPFRLYKHWVHEGGISTPLIVHWPARLPAGRRNQVVADPAHLIDLMATCLEVSSVAHPSTTNPAIPAPEGTSLLPALLGAPLRRGQPLFWEHEGNRAIREGDWKLVSRHPGAWELYHIGKDRTESHDLAAIEPEVTTRLAAAWETWARRVGVQPWPVRPRQRAANPQPAPESAVTPPRK